MREGRYKPNVLPTGTKLLFTRTNALSYMLFYMEGRTQGMIAFEMTN